MADLGHLEKDPTGLQDRHEQSGPRPVLIIQTDDSSMRREYTIVVIPLTTKAHRLNRPYAVDLSRLFPGKTSIALCHQVRALDRRALRYQMGNATPDLMADVEARISFVLGM